MKKQIFIVDDDPQIGRMFSNALARDGFEADSFLKPLEMLDHIDDEATPDLVLADMMMPNLNGIELLSALKERELHVPVIIMTGHSSVQSAVEAMKRGAFHYLQKPVNLEEMRSLIGKALDLYEAKEELEEIKDEQRRAFPIGGILGESEPIRRVRETIHTLREAPRTTVLLTGETGTGKNLAAQTIHYNSPHGRGRFMDINCAALPDNLLEAELFGYEKGAFTDAREAKPGLLEVADGGTVFLDEIDSMSKALQAKLLSFLESRVFRRLGGVKDLRVSTRVLCATNSNIERRVAEGAFRKDLFFRINVVNIEMPPVREMGKDILIVAQATIEEFNDELHREIEGFTPAAEEKLMGHPWPGNVRELRNVLERALIFSSGARLDAEDLTLAPPGDLETAAFGNNGFRFPPNESLEELERAYLLHTLNSNDASYAAIAEALGISKKTLWEKRKRYDLDAEVER